MTLDVPARLVAPGPGGLLAIVDDDHRLSVWDAATWQPLRVVIHEGGEPSAIAWSPAGVLAPAGGAAVALWDPRTGARLRR